MLIYRERIRPESEHESDLFILTFTRKIPAAAGLVLFAAAILSSCAGRHDPGIESGNKDGDPDSRLVRSFTRGGAPIRVEISVSADSITIADELELEISTIAGPSCTAALPSLADLDLGGFLVRDHRFEGPDATAGDSLRESVILSLEPQLSGVYTIAPFTVTFVIEDESASSPGFPADSTASAGPESAPGGENLRPVHEIITDPVEIVVGSLIAGEASQLTIRDVQGPERLPRNMKPWYLGAAALVVALALVIAAVWMLRGRRRSEAGKIEPSPYEKAIERLRRLRERKLLEQQLHEEFVIELSRIMRIYIGERFNVRAPEKTTEEFLDTILHNRDFSDGHRSVLGDFLKSCDLVKFAKYTPGEKELQESLDLTLKFIRETRSEQVEGAAD